MRITNNMMARGMLSNIHSQLRRMETLHHQLSSGKRLRVPSDDPAATAMSMKLHTHLSHTVQHKANVSSAISWLEATDSTLNEATETLQQAYELAVYGATGSHPQAAHDAIADEIDQILQHMVDLANSTHGGLHLFAGNETLTKPYDVDSSLPIGPVGSPPGSVDDNMPVYQGDQGSRRYETGTGVEVAVNITGDVVFDGIFRELVTLRDGLRNGDVDVVDGSVGALQTELDSLLSARADIGARANRLGLAQDRLHQLELNIEQLLLDTEGADIARALTDLKVTENVYRSALASGARMIQPTLLDFLR